MGGEWRGRRLRVPKSRSVRPSAGRAKESLFSMLGSIQMKRGLPAKFSGMRGLDLYAGAGGLGLEFLSRGGEHVQFVEYARESVRCLKENVAALQAEKSTHITVGQVLPTAKIWAKPSTYDIVFADPPYDIAELNQMISLCAEKLILRPNGLFIVEYDPKRDLTSPPGWALINERKVGAAALRIFGPES